MKCDICRDCPDNIRDEFNDCIIEYLERIKIHYLGIKSRLNESTTAVEELTKTNAELLLTVEKLRIDLSQSSSSESKRRKTNSFESIGEFDQFSHIKAVLPDKSTDDLNEALNEENWDDCFFVPATQSQSVQKSEDVQTKSVETYVKERGQNIYIVEPHRNSRDSSPTKKSINNITPLKCPPEELALPRRIKITSAKKNINNENKNILNTSKWVSKEQLAYKKLGALDKCWNMSFIQPVKGKDKQCKNSSFVDISPNNQNENKSPRSARKACSKFRQTKLNFNIKENENREVELEETFCEDLVAASPISVNIASNETGKLSKMLSLRKIYRQNPDNTIFISPKKKASSLSPKVSHESTENSPIEGKIKNEPMTVKKKNVCLRIPLSPAKSDPGITQCSQDDSVFILPSQPDDVICLEETDDLGSSTVDLLKDMILKEETFADVLRESEKLHAKSGNDQKAKSGTSPETPLRQKNLSVFNCNECETYFKYIGKDLSDGEIQRRLRNCCKHKRPISLHHTPEGFWDPYFRPLPPDDPRNETLIDTRFIDKKK